MIRINLLPQKAGRKKGKVKGGKSESFSTIFVAVLLVELLLCFLWWSGADDDLMAASASVAREKRALTDVQKKLDKLGGDKAGGMAEGTELLKRETNFFDRLMPHRTGHVQLLQFLAYILTKVEDSAANEDELIAQQKAGWKDKVIRVEEELHESLTAKDDANITKCQRLTDKNCWEAWRPVFIWPSRLSIKEKTVTIEGLARSHEYVAEFYQRLETGIYFLNLRPVLQEIVNDETFQDTELVSFKVEALFNPHALFGEKALAKMELKMAAGEVPADLKHLIIEPPKPKEEKGKKGKKGKKAKKPKKKGH